MDFKKGEKRPSKAGRKKGSVNKIPADVRQFVLDAANRFQEAGRGIETIPEEAFWTKIFPKIIPKDVNLKLQVWVRTLTDEQLLEHVRRLEAECAEKGIK